MTDELLPRLTEALADRYRIGSELGQGGMATVYLAEDLKHDRQVAIKVLKPELAAVIGGERFVTEIKTTASLQHPHILPLFDSGVADSFLYYVMPYVDGESLREKLDREKQLDVEEAVKIAAAVASALHYAHEQGIVHRDIKPANILIHAGEPVVADFGIALAISAAGGGRLTETGMSVGTPHYMSPEQASADRDVSARSDTYALACVLYEMLTGDPPHTGPTAQAVLMRILTEEPREVSDVRKAVPGNVGDALAKALQKLPADRFKTADEFKRALSDPDFTWRPKTRQRTGVGAAAAPAESEGRPWGSDFRTKLLVGANVAVLALLVWALGRGPGAAATALTGTGSVHRYVIQDSLRTDIFSAISSRGDVAYAGMLDGRRHLRLRRAADTASVEVPNSTDGASPIFSPDGEWVAFHIQSGNQGGVELRKVQLATGTSVTLVPEGQMTGIQAGHWTDGGEIFFSAGPRLMRVPAVGGQPEELLNLTGPAFWPYLLPNERTVVFSYFPTGDIGSGRVLQLDLETGDTLTIAPMGANAVWSPTGHIIHGHPSGTLFALPYDLESRAVSGPAVPVRESVFTIGAFSLFDLAADGSLVYLAGTAQNIDLATLSFSWLAMEGTFTPIPIEPTDHGDARVSPDGRQIAYTRGGDIYTFDLDLGTDQRLTFEGEDHHDPVWSPDGSRVVFSSNRDGGNGTQDLWVKDASGRADAEWLGGTEMEDYAYDWSSANTILGHRRLRAGEPADIFQAEIGGGTDEPAALLQATWAENSPQLSPDQGFMAYMSDESGDFQVYVRDYPGLRGRWQVSEEPVLAGVPFWSAEGDAIFYVDANGQLIRSDVRIEPDFRVTGHTVIYEPGPPYTLLDLHPDGGRFLVTRPQGVEQATGETEPSLVVVANWFSELFERLGQGN